ncbi:hypothetical protein PG997_011092 [Apiospora hydei]|uniref:Uncharacterized protein n=1 Tax=Apiospora hydei TaxID=1337664 RepID=A0ABR1VI25_9PEZI
MAVYSDFDSELTATLLVSRQVGEAMGYALLDALQDPVHVLRVDALGAAVDAVVGLRLGTANVGTDGVDKLRLGTANVGILTDGTGGVDRLGTANVGYPAANSGTLTLLFLDEVQVRVNSRGLEWEREGHARYDDREVEVVGLQWQTRDRKGQGR